MSFFAPGPFGDQFFWINSLGPIFLDQFFWTNFLGTNILGPIFWDQFLKLISWDRYFFGPNFLGPIFLGPNIFGLIFFDNFFWKLFATRTVQIALKKTL